MADWWRQQWPYVSPSCGGCGITLGAGHLATCPRTVFAREPDCDCPNDLLYAFGHQPECQRATPSTRQEP